MRKGDDENHVGGKFDLKGSGAITDQVDNVFIVWRNKRKALERQQNGVVDESIPDAALVCEKQRNGDWEGRIGLWFHPDSNQYVAEQFGAIEEYVER
jgi:twinkle protein